MAKVLEITVKAAHNLYDPNWISSLDPYCVVTCGNQTHKTKAINKSKNPVWNQNLVFEWTPDVKNIEFKVWDEDRGKDDFVGEAGLTLKDEILIKGFVGDLALFRKNGNKAGLLKVEMTWKTQQQHTAAAGTQLAMAALGAHMQNNNSAVPMKSNPYAQMQAPQMAQPQMVQAQPQMVQPQVVQANGVVMQQPMMMQQQSMMMQQQPVMMPGQPMMMQQQPVMMQGQPIMMMQQRPVMMMQQQPMMMQQQPMMQGAVVYKQ